MSCTICENGLHYPAGAHAVGCSKRAHLDAEILTVRAAELERGGMYPEDAARQAELETLPIGRTIGQWPTCQLAMCGRACGADECGT